MLHFMVGAILGVCEGVILADWYSSKKTSKVAENSLKKAKRAN